MFINTDSFLAMEMTVVSVSKPSGFMIAGKGKKLIMQVKRIYQK